MLALRATKARSWTNEYVRHGTRTVLASVEVATGKVIAHVRKRRTSKDFLAFMDSTHSSGDECRTLRQGESFALIIRSDDGRTLLETRAEYMHQAFQRLIDWSIGAASHEGVARLSAAQTGFTRNTQSKLLETLDSGWTGY